MAIGTGLPIPEKTGFAVPEAPPPQSGDFGASSFARNAQAYEHIAKAGLVTAELARSERVKEAEKQANQLKAGQLAEHENENRRFAADLAAKEATAEGGPDGNRALKAGQDYAAKKMQTIADPEMQAAVKKDIESRVTGVYTSIVSHNAQTQLNNAREATDQNIKATKEEYNTALIKDEMFDADGNYTQKGAALAAKLDFTVKQAVKNGQHSPEWAQNHIDDVAGNAAGITIGRKVYKAVIDGTITEQEAAEQIRKNTVENNSLNDVMKAGAYTRANEFFNSAWAAHKKELSSHREEANKLRTLYKGEGIDSVSANDHAIVRSNLLRFNDIKSVADLDTARAVAAGAASINSGGPIAVQQQLSAAAAAQQGVTEGDVNAVKRFEGFEPRAKWDARQYSVGYGTRAAGPNETISPEAADARLRGELGQAAAALNQRFPGLKQNNPGAWSALLSLTYNAGPGWADAGLGAQVRQSMQTGDWGPTANKFLEYNKSRGQYIPGLQTRRNREVQWFFSGGPDAGAAPQPGRGALGPTPYPEGEPPGLITAGNVNLYERPIVEAPGGGKATVRSITVEMDGKHYVLPTVIQGSDEHGADQARIVSNDEAIEHFRRTGQHLGSFKTEQDARRYAKRLHQTQAEYYGMTPAQQRMTVPEATGASTQPTIDLSRRQGPVDAIVITDDGKNVIIPSRSETGERLSTEDAVKQYKDSGDHYGKFDKLADANAYQQALRATPALRTPPTVTPPTTTGAGGARVAAGPPPPPGPGGRVPIVPVEAPAVPAPVPTQTEAQAPSLGGVPNAPTPATLSPTAQQQTGLYAPVNQARIYEQKMWETQEKWLKDNWSRLEPLVAKGQFNSDGVDAGSMFNIVDSPYVKDKAFAQKVKATMAAGAFGAAMTGLPTGQRQASIEAFEADMRAKHVPPDVQKLIMDRVTQQNTELNNLARTDPQAYRRAQGAAPLTPFDFNNLDQSLRAIQERRITAASVAAENHIPAPSILNESDKSELASAITTGNKQQVEVATRVLAQMTAEEARTSMGGEHNPLKTAIIGAQASTDLDRYDLVNGAMKKWKDGDPLRYTFTMTPESEKMLDAWTVNRTTYSAQETIDKNVRMKDPQYAEQIAKAQKGDGQHIADWKAVKPEQMAAAINPTFYNKTVGWLAPGSTQGGPPGELGAVYPFGNPHTAALFESQMQNVYLDLRAKGATHDLALSQAAQVMGRTWGVTAATGKLMKFPPEKVTVRDGETTANVGGSMEWLNQQIDDFVDGHYGQQPATGWSALWGLPSGMRRSFTGQPGALGPVNLIPGFPSTRIQRFNYVFDTLISDEITEKEIALGVKTPSYGVIVTTPDGRKEVVVDPDGRQRRFVPDRDRAINEYNASTARVRHEGQIEAIRRGMEGMVGVP